MPNAEWTAYLAQPLAMREAIQEKVQAAFRDHGIQAGRDAMQALGMPTPPPEMHVPADVLEARRADEEPEPDDEMDPPPAGRVDH